MAALGAFFVLTVGLSACGSGVPGDSVATMAGNSISTQAFNHWMYVAAEGNAQQNPSAPVIVPSDPPSFTRCIAEVRTAIPSLAKTSKQQLKADCGQLFTSLSTQVMDFLIRAYWYQAEAAKRHVTVSDKEVQQAFQTAKAQEFSSAGAFSQFLASSGQTLPDILFRVRINQLLKKLLAAEQKPITAATIQAYYTSHASQFGSPETRDLRLVRTSTAAEAAAAMAALQHGQSWQTVAKRYSEDKATKNNGGLLSGVTRGQEEQALNTVAFSSPRGKLVGPVHGTFGYYVVEVVGIKPATQQSLAKATPLIRQLLQSTQQQNAQSALDKQVKKDWQRQTKCRSAYAMADCSGYKAPKSSSSAASGAAGTTTAAP